MLRRLMPKQMPTILLIICCGPALHVEREREREGRWGKGEGKEGRERQRKKEKQKYVFEGLPRWSNG